MSEKQTLSVSLTDIEPNPWNPHGMTDAEFSLLRQSVKDKGQWRPIVVIEMDVPDEYTPEPEGKYRIIDGSHLHRAMIGNHLEDGESDTGLVLVYGKNSEVPVEVQMEIGQTINHGMRGSLEDTKKTGLIVDVLTRRFPIEEIARRTGQSATFLESARRVAAEPSLRRAAPVTVRSNAERQGQTVPLVFEDNASLGQYQESVKVWESWADPEGSMTPGRRRIAAVLAALSQAPVSA
ncbi:hypothetical protein Dxin01_00194 [Deinococcus xinjiangensis]|uniref:ParB-like N-terminal domain-containing protein n=1 Tax=Deinococcus xinjiangensis TaxID=457454 RepID=A0ABP9V5B1_9DEIO